MALLLCHVIVYIFTRICITIFTIQLLVQLGDNIMAESPKFKFHTMIRVRALDEVEGTNGEVNYRLLSGGSGVFEIEENTGQISLLSALDTSMGTIKFSLLKQLTGENHK